MSPEAQRIAIAEACGWKGPNSDEVKERTKNWVTRDTQDHFISPVGVSCGKAALPDYLNDLNAMHEAAKSLDGYMMLKYASELLALTGGAGTGGSFSNIHASAAQRAEAFLKAIWKWAP